jgi:transcriptional regulator with XRE-family HTH domain
VGQLVKQWRERRRTSQLGLAIEADISARHLSFVETGRTRPSREMVLHLSRALDVPPRARNELLTAAGYAPLDRETPLDAPEMAQVKQALGFLGGWRLDARGRAPHIEGFPGDPHDRPYAA